MAKTNPALRRQIQALNRLNLDVVDYSAVKEQVNAIFKHFTVTVTVSGLSSSLFRVRKNPSSKPTHVNHLKAPPPEYVNGFQRCNGPGNPMFYAATKRIGAILESRVEPGDTVYLGQWRIDKRFTVNSLLHPKLSADMGLPQNSETALAFIDTVFTRPVHDTYSSQYMITAALTERLTSDFPNDGQFETADDGFVGLYYPSVVDIENTLNVAMHPNIVERCLTLAHVMEATVVSCSNRNVTLNVTDNSNAMEDDNIEWLGNPDMIPLPQMPQGTMYVSTGKVWRLGVRDTPHTTDDMTYLLNE